MGKEDEGSRGGEGEMTIAAAMGHQCHTDSHSVLSQSLARVPMAWGGRGKSHPRSLLSDSLLGAQPISSVRRLRHMGEEEVRRRLWRGRVVVRMKAEVGGMSKV